MSLPSLIVAASLLAVAVPAVSREASRDVGREAAREGTRGDVAAAAEAARAARAAVDNPPQGRSQDDPRVRKAMVLRRIERTLASGKVADARSLMPLLKDDDAGVRRDAEKAIWQLWARSGNPEADRMLALGVDQIRRGDPAAAIETLSRVIDYAPRFAEAWNKRATARYVTGDLIGALDDMETVLRLMPDHFGSLAGYGHIYYRLEDMDQAVAYWERALAINPNLERIERTVEAVRRQMAARGRVST
jgi:tetratricopeptide (TPR) repeat protein